MKRYLSALFLLPLLFASCSEEQIEMMPPYIFFTYDVDTYVMDANNPNPADYVIKGSISAEGGFERFVMGDETLEKDVLGDSLNRMFDYTVPLAGRINESFDVDFMLTDQTGNTVSKPFHFVTSNPIDTYNYTMGAQNNTYAGFFFSFEDCQVHPVSEMMAMSDPKGFCFGYNRSKGLPMLVSPTELINQLVLNDYKGRSITSFCEVAAFEGVNFTLAQFNTMTNDAFMRNLNPVEYSTFPYQEISAGKAYLFKNEDDTRRGIVYIHSLESGISGSIQVTIKIQQ